MNLAEVQEVHSMDLAEVHDVHSMDLAGFEGEHTMQYARLNGSIVWTLLGPYYGQRSDHTMDYF
jgi:hypothetical protein